MSRPTLDETYLKMAQVLSERAACTRRQVGALLVDSETRIVAAGYNGVPSGELHCSDGGCPRGRMSYEEVKEFTSYDNCTALHAELNALIRAGDKARGATLYVTCQMCSWCEKVARAANVARVVWPDGELDLNLSIR